MTDILAWKLCPACNVYKLKTQFSKNRSKKDGLSTYCKACQTESKRKSVEKNGEKYKAQARKHRKEMRAVNHQKELEYDRKRYKENKEYFRDKHIRWYAENKEKAIEYTKQWVKDNIEKVLVRQHNRHAKTRQNGGTITEKEWRELKKKYNYTCLACRRQEPEIKLTLDHVVPISKGGSNTIDNIQPLCGSCNTSKYTKVIDYR